MTCSSSEEEDSVWAPEEDQRKQTSGEKERKRSKRSGFNEVGSRTKSYQVAEELAMLTERLWERRRRGSC